METWVVVVIAISSFIVALAIGIFSGMFIAQKRFKKQLDENPPITESMIRAMFLQMGRKPSESQIKAVMRSMKQAK
ncbi:YneF family protein [Mycoplasma phocoenae]|uniref:YneF family protein n=1 Tax=Mycoplasma phocoenae TaxID=754517 RepID=A0A858U3G0_9MOLU|nr:YneF family protein [Mycoplasma phocoenae]QJG66952.1 YneF family protein [Mycoplasma phocoenae]